MRQRPFIFIILLTALLFCCVSGAKAFASALGGPSSPAGQVEVNVWYPFGRIQTAAPQASFQVSRRFTGQVFDSESGLYYYNARYYDPELGRFVQPDTVIPDFGNPQSYNRYSYCVNDPLIYNDPTGHDYVYAKPGDLMFGFVNGPYQYMNARSTLGSIGAGIYNAIPFAANSIYQVSRPINAVFTAAGDVAHGATLAVTGDPQLADNVRNLPLLAGGTMGVVTKIERAAATTEKVTAATGAIADEAKVIRGGGNLPADIIRGTGTHPSGVTGVSVETAEGKSVKELSANIPHGKVGVTTVGDVRAAGGDVVRTSGRSPNHATLTGLTPEKTSELLTPTIPNPAKP